MSAVAGAESPSRGGFGAWVPDAGFCSLFCLSSCRSVCACVGGWGGLLRGSLLALCGALLCSVLLSVGSLFFFFSVRFALFALKKIP